MVKIVIIVTQQGVFHFVKVASVDVEEIRKVGHHNVFAGKVRDDMESSDRPVEDGTIELTDNICTTFVAGNDDERTRISGAHLVVEHFLYSSIVDKNQIATLKIEITNCGSVFMLETNGSLYACVHDFQV